MTAKTIAKALGGRKIGKGWSARCPAHEDRTPSLSICDGHNGVLVYCHAGCLQRDVIGCLRRRGLWSGSSGATLPVYRSPHRSLKDVTLVHDQRTVAAKAIWDASIPVSGTYAETYLAQRGLVLSLPQSLRFHAGIKHPAGGTWPCLVAAVMRGSDENVVAIHRTYLSHDGKGKAPKSPAKMMLGPCRGGAVRLGAMGETMMVGEGIETCLSAMQETGLPAWAALSTSGLRNVELPAPVRRVIILADGDDAGEAAAIDAAKRWSGHGRQVRIARPPRGLDFNDMLLARKPNEKGCAR